ncbi:Zinc metalloproteinase nas-36-like protein [Dinothrombium tinctorium]|uniref:Metalloendopeptidase n=1 Tax=Dinothrombium tinctorium TaxID=1965070 RepID=A0A3S3NXV5_9ACAR|nr:Zinc metalloproteinase nas-36-like protein [Dinothrombium tinctorium]
MFFNPISYILEENVGTARLKQSLDVLFKHLEQHTCLKFEKADNVNTKEDYHTIRIKYRDPGWCGIEEKYVGILRNQTYHEINLSWYCLDNWYIGRVLMHVFGLPHEMNRPDRDDFIYIFTHDKMWDDAFDQLSVMNYEFDDFQRDPNIPTILPLSADINPINFGKNRKYKDLTHPDEFPFTKFDLYKLIMLICRPTITSIMKGSITTG